MTAVQGAVANGAAVAACREGGDGSAPRALLIVNRNSRQGREKGQEAAAALRALNVSLLETSAESRDALGRAIRDHAHEVDRVIVGGGDGTVNATASALVETGLPLGILPLGTANDLARTLGLPLDLAGAAAVAARGHRHPIDLGEVNGHLFFNVASLGFGVDLTRALTSDAKRRWGALGYAVAGLRVLRRLRPFHAEIAVGDARTRSRTVHLAIGNGRHYGGGMTVHAQARIDDGTLHVYSLEIETVWQLLRLLPALRSGELDHYTEIRTLAGQDVRVTTRRPRSVNADGEIVARTPALFKVRPSAVQVLVPR